MDKISEIINNIKDRLANPLIFSFLISFLIFNWEISISLFWYDKSQFEAEGCRSIFEFIAFKWYEKGSVLFPFLFSIGYTFLFPMVKNIIQAFQTWVLTWGENWNLQISKKGKVDMDKYLSLRSEYMSKLTELENVIKTESVYRDENQKLLIEKNTFENNFEKTKLELIDIKKQTEKMDLPNAIQGYWNIQSLDAVGNRINQKYLFENLNCYKISEIDKKLEFILSDFNYNFHKKTFSK